MGRRKIRLSPSDDAIKKPPQDFPFRKDETPKFYLYIRLTDSLPPFSVSLDDDQEHGFRVA